MLCTRRLARQHVEHMSAGKVWVRDGLVLAHLCLVNWWHVFVTKGSQRQMCITWVSRLQEYTHTRAQTHTGQISYIHSFSCARCVYISFLINKKNTLLTITFLQLTYEWQTNMNCRLPTTFERTVVKPAISLHGSVVACAIAKYTVFICQRTQFTLLQW